MDPRVIRAFTPVFDGLCPRVTTGVESFRSEHALASPRLRPGIDQRSVAANLGLRRDTGRVDPAVGHNVKHRLPGGNQIVRDNAAVAAPPYRFRAHDGTALLAAACPQMREARAE